MIMQSWGRLLLGLVSAAAVGLVSSCAWHAAQPHCPVTVRPGESIQGIIDAAETGAVICLARGIWAENLMIAKSLTLKGAGAGRTTIQGARYAHPAVQIAAPESESISVLLEGLTVTGADGSSGVSIGCAKVEIRGCNLSRSWYGVEVGDSAHLTLSDSAVFENAQRGLVLAGSARASINGSRISGNMGPGIWLSGSAEATFLDCDISGNAGHGLWLRDEARAELSGCSVSGNEGQGLWLRERSEARLLGSSISRNRDQGVRIEDSARVELTESSLLSNWDGIELRDGAQGTIAGGTVSGNRWDGVRIRDSAQAAISGCTVSGNGWQGIWLGGMAQAEIRGCRIEKNGGYGIFSWSRGEVRGGENRLRGNGVDLGGNLAGSLRLPLKEPSEPEITYPDERYASLQEAIDALVPGGKLLLEEGDYTASLTIGKELWIEASDGEVALEAKSATVPVLSLVGGAELYLKGVAVSGGSEGLLISADGRAELAECAIFGNLNGIHLWQSAQALTSDCTISENEQSGIWMGDTAQATVSGCQLLGNGWQGIAVGGAARAVISSSTVSRNGRNGGIVLRDSAQGILEENSVIANWGYGVGLYHLHCFGSGWTFTGRVEGGGNLLDENHRGTVCPAELQFLETAEGGVLDLRLQD